MCLQAIWDTELPLLFHQTKEFQSAMHIQSYKPYTWLKKKSILFNIYILDQKIKPPTCLIPCQWMERFSVTKLLLTWTIMVSPSCAWMLGPGVLPLIVITSFLKQSGDLNSYFTSHLWCLILASALWKFPKMRKKHRINSVGNCRALMLNRSSTMPS